MLTVDFGTRRSLNRRHDFFCGFGASWKTTKRLSWQNAHARRIGNGFKETHYTHDFSQRAEEMILDRFCLDETKSKERKVPGHEVRAENKCAFLGDLTGYLYRRAPSRSRIHLCGTPCARSLRWEWNQAGRNTAACSQRMAGPCPARWHALGSLVAYRSELKTDTRQPVKSMCFTQKQIVCVII